VSTDYSRGMYSGMGAYVPPVKVSFGWIGQSFDIFKSGAGLWIAAVLIYGILINVIAAIIRTALPNPAYVQINPFGPHGVFYSNPIGYGTNSPFSPLGQVLNLLLSWIIGAYQSASLYRMANKQVRGLSPVFADTVGGGPVFVPMLVYTLLLSLACVVGTAALCLGLFVVLGFLLPGYALVADGETAGNAFSRSLVAMKQDWLNATLFVLVFALLIAVSVIPCGLGLFVTIPMAHIVSALAYRDMIGMPGIPTDTAFDYGAAQPGVWPPPPTVTPPPPIWPPPPGTAGSA